MKIIKILVSILPVCLIFILTACGCEHEWTEATCLNPKTCALCGATEGVPIEHKWTEATCIKPKTCTLCGATEGEPIEHSYMDANCDNPKRCSFCDATEGKALGHDYADGYCTRCYMKDPNYIDLNNFGFDNMYGMNIWLEVSEYNSEDNSVYIRSHYPSQRDYMYFYIFSDSYFQSGFLSIQNTDPITSITADMIKKSDTILYNVITNDVISLDSGEDGTGTFTITERIVDSNNSKLVIKTHYEALLRESKYKYVPVELLDFSTLAFDADEMQYYVKFK